LGIRTAPNSGLGLWSREQYQIHAQISPNSNLKQTQISFTNFRLNWVFVIVNFYSNLQGIEIVEAKLHGHTWTSARAPVRRPKSSINVVHAFGFQPRLAPNIRQLVGVVEWESFAAKGGKNSLGFGSLVLHVWWRRGGRR